jgi:anti-sigma regulatory factor (Ser/Thr protein kinase)
VRLTIFPTVEAPGRARRELSSLAGRVDQRALSDLRTVVSELVAVSIANGARSPIEVQLQLEAERIEGCLHDDGAGARALDRPESALVRRIVGGLVDEWRPEPGERQVWFRISVR